MSRNQYTNQQLGVFDYDTDTAGVLTDDQLAAIPAGAVTVAEEAPYAGAKTRQTLVLPTPAPRGEMSSMAGAVPLAALTASTGSHIVELHASYDDRAAGFVRSTLPMWWAVSGASAAIVLVVWIIGPLSGKWAFEMGWWATSELLTLALASVGVWAVMWWRWHHDGPDAIASRSADTRLRMAERWFSAELKRTYGDNDEQG
jgi:hypothetical protein